MGQRVFPLTEDSNRAIVLASSHWGLRKEIQVIVGEKILGTLDRITTRASELKAPDGGSIEISRSFWGVDVRYKGETLPNSATHPARMMTEAGIILGFLGVWYFVLSVFTFLLGSDGGPLFTEAFLPFAFGGALLCLGLGHVVYWHHNRLALLVGALFYTLEPSMVFFEGESHFIVAKIVFILCLWRPFLPRKN